MIYYNSYYWKSCRDHVTLFVGNWEQTLTYIILCGQSGDTVVLHQGGIGVNRQAEWWNRQKETENPNCFTRSSFLNVCNKVTTIML